MSEFQKAHIKRIETDNKRKKTIIEKLKVENKKLRKDILMFQARYMELLPINKKLRECVEVMLEYSNCSWDKHPVRTEKESVEYVEKCLEEIEKE